MGMVACRELALSVDNPSQHAIQLVSRTRKVFSIKDAETRDFLIAEEVEIRMILA